MLRLFLVLLSLNTCVVSSGQTPTLDSLNNTWVEIQDDSLRLANKKNAAWFLYQNYQDEEGLILALANLEEAKAADLRTLESISLLQLTYFTLNLAQIDSFNLFWGAAYNASKQLKDTLNLYDLLNIKAGQLVNELKYDSAFTIYHEALDLSLASNDVELELSIYNNLAILFGEQGLIDKAKSYFMQAAQAGLSINDSASVYLGYSNIARCFIEVEQADSAIHYLSIAEPWLDHVGGQFFFSNFFLLRGWVAKLQQETEQALTSFYQSLNLAQEVGEKRLTLAEIGHLHAAVSNYDSAVYYLQKVELMSLDARDNISLRDVLPALAKSYAALGDFPKAYEYAQRAIDFRDEHLAEEVQRQVAEMDAKYELENLSSDNEILKIIAHERGVTVRQRTIFAIIGLIGLFIISALLFKIWKRNQTIRAFNVDLERKVADRTQKLEVANRKLQDYLEDLRMFTHVTSHDLKEPLRNISGFSSLLERRIAGDLADEDTKTFMQMIRSNANQMHRLIEGIQFYTTIDAPTSDKKLLENVSLTNIIEQVKVTLATAIVEKKAQVIIVGELPDLYTSVSVVQVITKNLIENGIKYNQSPEPTVVVSYQQEENSHCIHIKDNGIGISTDYQQQIFDMFKRLHTQEEYVGTGMGLTISRRLARRFNGDILLESKEGEGSIFTLRIPIQEE